MLRALGFAGVWLTSPLFLALGPLLLHDGTRGLWLPLAWAGGAVLVAVVLAAPWRGLAADRGGLPDLVEQRWPGAGVGAPVLVASLGGAFFLLWAVLAAAGELAHALGWSRPVAIGAVALGLAVATWRPGVGGWIAGLGGAATLAGLLVPLAAVLVITDPLPPRVWEAVAERTRIVFSDTGPWVTQGHAVHGTGLAATLTITEEQKVALLGQGRVRLELWDGQVVTRDVVTPTELAVRPGDRLVLPDGFEVRFQPGRRIPGAPASGVDWLDPSGGRLDWRTIVGLGLTMALGGLGLAPAHAVLGGRQPGQDRAALLGALLVVGGCAAAVLWALYGVWLTPEIYLGGVAGAELFELPARLSALGAAGPPLRDLALLGLASGGLAGGTAALSALPRVLPAAPRLGILVVAGVLAAATPAGSWTLLVTACGLAASAGAPAAVLGCWRERLGAGAVAAGASLGLLAFAALAASRLAVGGGSWLTWLAAWPAVVALPLNLVVTWLLSAGPRPSRHAPLPAGFADLHT
jgi:hypothetical protein